MMKLKYLDQGKKHFTQKIYKMWDEEGNEIDVAPHPQQIIKIKMDSKVNKWDIIRKSREDDIYG